MVELIITALQAVRKFTNGLDRKARDKGQVVKGIDDLDGRLFYIAPLDCCLAPRLRQG